MHLNDFKNISINGIKMNEIRVGDTVIWKGGRIPSEYQEVEYIYQTDACSYLDLGFAFDTACIIYMGYKKPVMASPQIFGAAENSGKYRCMLSDSTSQLLLYGASGSAYVIAGIPVGTNYMDLKVINEAGNLRIEDLITGTYDVNAFNVAFTMSNNLYLLGQNYNGTPRGSGNGYVYYFKYYDKTSTLICDLVPCYRKSDGEIGMYDLVRKIFLTNAGTGNLLKGADI